jgi:hypothetical protein
MVLGGDAVLYRSRFMLLSTYYISVGGMKAQKTGPVAYCDHPLPVRIYSKTLLCLFSQVCVIIAIKELRQGSARFRTVTLVIQSFRTHETIIDETFPEALCSRDSWTVQANATGSDNTG